LRFEVRGLGVGASDVECGVSGLGFRAVYGFGCRIRGVGCGVRVGYQVSGVGCRVQGVG